MVQLYGFIFTSILGTIGHYLYKFTNNDKIIGFLFSKSESLYQHLKLGYTPILLWMIVENFKVLNNQNLIAIKGVSLLIFTSVIAIPYFIFNKVLKKNIKFINLFSFYFGLFISYLSTFLLLNSIYLSLFIKLTGIFSFIIVISSYFIQNITIKKSVVTHSRSD